MHVMMLIYSHLFVGVRLQLKLKDVLVRKSFSELLCISVAMLYAGTHIESVGRREI